MFSRTERIADVSEQTHEASTSPTAPLTALPSLPDPSHSGAPHSEQQNVFRRLGNSARSIHVTA